MKYESFCGECNQVYDIYLFKGGICTYCWSIKGMDHPFIREDVRIFGTIVGAANSDIKLKWKWEE